MRREDKLLTDDKRINEILKTAPIGRMGTIGVDGPMIKPVNFVYMNEAFYIHSAKEGEKIEHITTDPRVCFEMEGDTGYRPSTGAPCDAGYKYESVIAKGRAFLVEDPAEKTKALSALMEKYQPEGGYKPVTESMSEAVAIIRIDVGSITAKVSPPIKQRGT